MTLDRKTKDIDASIELLEDRKKKGKIWFFVFFSVGWFTTLFGAIISLSPKINGIVAYIGIGVMILAAYFLILTLYVDNLIYLKRHFEREKKT